MMKSILVASGLLLAIVSCKEVEHERESKKHTEIECLNLESEALMHVLDSFVDLNISYNYCTNNIGYLKVLNIDGDTFKVYLTSLKTKETILDKIYYDGIIKKKGFLIAVDFGESPLFYYNNRGKLSSSTFQTESRKKPVYDCQADFSWLFLIQGDKIQKANFDAPNMFGPPCENCLEWGSEGQKISYYRNLRKNPHARGVSNLK